MEDENHKVRLAELEALDKKILQAQQRLECYQARLSLKKGATALFLS